MSARTKILVVVSILLPSGLVESAAQADEVPIVYSRCPRGAKPFTVTGPLVKGGVTTTATTTVRNGDLLEMLPETARPIGNFVAPCDLIYRDGKGAERILYSCIANSTPEKSCAALDAAVSFDAKTVAFSVFRGPLERLRGLADGTVFDPAAQNLTYFYADLPGSNINPTESQIVLVDVATGTPTPLPFPPNTINFGPAWLSNGRIAFSSTGRRPIYAPMPLCTNNPGTSIQLYAMDADGRNVELVSPHAAAAELHPLQLTNGRVAVSSWQEFGMLAYRHGNSFGGCGTLSNFFHVFAQDPDGANANALYGQHLADPTYTDYPLGTHMAAHFFGQTSDGRVWTAEYYRANNLGLGLITGFPIPPAGQEGPTAVEAAATKGNPYRVPGQVRLASWASNSDQPSAPMPAPPLMLPGYADPIKYAGKLGHPSGLPGNQLMVTWGVGPCSLNSGVRDIAAMQALTKEAGDNPACDVGIYRTNTLPANASNFVKHPSELVPIVNSPDFHEFLARAVVPYKDIYGIDRPKDIPRAELAIDGALAHGTPFGVLGASSIIHRETKALAPISYEWDQPALQGTDSIDYSDDELCGVRILAVHANRKVESNWKSTSTVGERVSIVGEFPVRKWDANGKPVMDALGAPDTSFRVRFPASSPYLMQAIDCEGRTLNTDQTWQSLRPGEVKTCNGCHVHSSAATKLPYDKSWAATAAATTYELGAGKVPLLVGGSGQSVKTKEIDGYQYMIEFDRDVMPILQTRCASCHGATAAGAGLRLDVARTWAKVQTGMDDSTYARLALDPGQAFVPVALQRIGTHGTNLGKPNLSRYVRMMNSRGSLLYWKARNARTDNRTDAQATDDVDFGAAHPTAITPDELGVLARWIDTGSGWGPEFIQDKIYPALHVVGVVSGSTVTAIGIGTADIGDGIDPDSLSACVIPKPGEACGPNLAGKAELAGVATVALASPLSNPDAEVWVTVKDRAGNMSEGRYTVRFLLALPPPGTSPDAGADGGPDGVGPRDQGGGCSCLLATSDAGGAGLALFGAVGAGALLILRTRRRRGERRG